MKNIYKIIFDYFNKKDSGINQSYQIIVNVEKMKIYIEMELNGKIFYKTEKDIFKENINRINRIIKKMNLENIIVNDIYEEKKLDNNYILEIFKIVYKDGSYFSGEKYRYGNGVIVGDTKASFSQIKNYLRNNIGNLNLEIREENY